MKITIRHIQADDLVQLDQALSKHNIRRRTGYFEQCLNDNHSKKRVTFIAMLNNEYAGFAHLLFASAYPHFNKSGIPEINDLFVFPPYRKQGIASALIQTIENFGFAKFSEIGLGVGLYRDYGNAQSLYMKHGYIADGNGLHYKNNPIEPGQTVRVDDDLLVYLTKRR